MEVVCLVDPFEHELGDEVFRSLRRIPVRDADRARGDEWPARNLRSNDDGTAFRAKKISWNISEIGAYNWEPMTKIQNPEIRVRDGVEPRHRYGVQIRFA